MKKNKYKVTFYKLLCSVKFTRVCTRTKLSVFKYALKTALNKRAVFKIYKLNK